MACIDLRAVDHRGCNVLRGGSIAQHSVHLAQKKAARVDAENRSFLLHDSRSPHLLAQLGINLVVVSCVCLACGVG